MNPLIRSVSVNGKDIQRIVYDKLAPACETEELDHAILSMLTFTVILIKPDIKEQQLKDAVMNVSEYLILQLMDESTEDAPTVTN